MTFCSGCHRSILSWIVPIPGERTHFAAELRFVQVLSFPCSVVAACFPLIRLADKLDINLLTAAQSKIEVNERKYPVDKAKGCAKKYTELV